MRYHSVLYVTHNLIRYSGGAHDYFRGRSDRFFVLSVTPTFLREECRLDEFRGGGLFATHAFRYHIGMPMPIQYAFFYSYFLWTAFFILPRGTLVLNYHPLFCVGNYWLRLLRGLRQVFWVFDYFDKHDGFYAAYNRLADHYVRTMKDVRFLSPVMMAKYAARLGPWRPGVRRETVELGISPSSVTRAVVQGRLGFIGNLKEGQGLELAFQALAGDDHLTLDVIGDGVIRAGLEALATDLGLERRVRWLGAIIDEEVIAREAAHWEAGIATYERGDYLECADPGKIKLYWQCGVPVIMTRISHLAEKAERVTAAAVIGYDSGALTRALQDIRARMADFEKGVKAMRETYDTGRHFDHAFGSYGRPD